MKKDIDIIADDSIEGIAIIGLAGRFPGAKNINQFWQNLRNGVESIMHFTDDELKAQGVPPEILNDPNYVKAGTIIDDAEKFDAAFFGYTPREAELLDPQQRIFLETAWEALENAGYDADAYDGPIGVFAGANQNKYVNRLISGLEPNNVARAFQILIGNDKDFLSTRVSYKLNLKGPSLTIQTACSTSLVAVQLACQSLLNYQCSIALAGGVSIDISQRNGYYYQEGTIVSPDGHCRAFDAKANGTVLGQGSGIVVLKRLSDALADRDTIHAVIKGFAVNNDGALKAGYTVPSVDGQAEVIAMALELSGVAAESIGYIETHGTGTPLGDPVEIAALTQAFRSYTQKKGFCAIGSVKTNIGHADAAAGVAGLIKTVLSLKYKEIPPSLHFEKPNPKIDFESSPFYVNNKLTEWKYNGIPRRAGVSSFGIGGTNAHVILEEAPTVDPSGESRSQQLILLSAKTNTALDKATKNLSEYLRQHSQLNLADVAYTLQAGHKVFDHRRMLVCQDLADAVSSLEVLDPNRVLTSFQEKKTWDIVFMFSGQGSQYVDMGLELYRTESIFQEQIDLCSEILKPYLSLDLRDILYPNKKNRDEATQELEQTFITQPALFVIEYALAKLWQSWGICPNILVGHSVGEYTAACLAGVFSLEDALSLVSARARLIQELPPGSMLVVPLSEKEILPFLDDEISVAAVNSPSFCVVSGEKDAIEDLEKRLSKQNVDSRRLRTSHAFHSRMMEPILGTFTEKVKQIKMNPPQIPVVSTVSGTWITSDEIMKPDYWAKNIRQTVRFFDCIKKLSKNSNNILLEVGPGNTLVTLARQYPDKPKEQILLYSVRHPNEKKSDLAFILSTLGKIWIAGVQVDWPGFYQKELRHRIPLPVYPFERQGYWVKELTNVKVEASDQKLSNKKKDLSEWFYIPSWKRSQLPQPQGRKVLLDQKINWLVFLDECGLGDKLVNQLQQTGQCVTTVKVGARFERFGEGEYTLNPKKKEDYYNLFKELRITERIPQKIVHLWCLTKEEDFFSGRGFLKFSRDLGFNSLLFLAQSIDEQLSGKPIQIKVISNNLQEVTGEEMLIPEKATILGFCQVAPEEYPNIRCTSIDVLVPKADTKQEEELKELLLRELTAENLDPIIAYRGKHRWMQAFEPISLEKDAVPKSKLREHGVYMITGGLGGIGLVLAEYLAQTVKAKLVLIARTGLPERCKWEEWLESHDKEDVISHKIRKVQSIEEYGAEVLVLSADVANMSHMEEAIARIYDRFGQIHGVIHAAGIAGGGVMQLKTLEMAENIMAPKVKGTEVLGKLLSEVKLDFFVLCSALDSLLGRVGQVDYCAANAFLDAYAHQHRSGNSVISINWDAWQEVGMAVNTEVPYYLKEERKQNLKLGILPEEGKEAFIRILGSSSSQVIVSTRNLLGLMEKGHKVAELSYTEKPEKISLTEAVYARPNLSSVYVVPGNPTEQTVAEIWQQVLGIDKVGIHDNFFELGGDSLLATQVITRLRNAFPIEFPMTILFEKPTVQLISMFVLDGQKEEHAFVKSRERGQKRSERKRHRIISKRDEEIS